MKKIGGEQKMHKMHQILVHFLGDHFCYKTGFKIRCLTKILAADQSSAILYMYMYAYAADPFLCHENWCQYISVKCTFLLHSACYRGPSGPTASQPFPCFLLCCLCYVCFDLFFLCCFCAFCMVLDFEEKEKEPAKQRQSKKISCFQCFWHLCGEDVSEK